jgi:enoyl-CoA hydratase
VVRAPVRAAPLTVLRHNRDNVTIGRVDTQRLTPAHFNRAMILAEVYAPDEAAAAGFLDRVVPADQLAAAAQATAERLGQLDLAAHAATKLRTRGPTVDAIARALEEDARALAGGA